MRDLATRFTALADPTRLQMLALLLRRGELCVCDFVETLGITQSKASRHLRHLWTVGLLEDRRAGLWVYYRIAPNLDAERKALVSALTRLFEGRDLGALEQRLNRWLKRKGGTVPTCKATPKTRARAAVEARR
ncbi:MAG: metalloregulator ArsR/SmtB family transcription factor [Candidatus Binatia bacterium]|jgi:ArsR family transcriptional regulator, arsenate/arsenite/antimonite-responsive transcriptional repressor